MTKPRRHPKPGTMTSHDMRVRMGWEVAKPRLKPGLGVALPPGIEIPDVKVYRKPPMPEEELKTQNVLRELVSEGDPVKLRIAIQVYRGPSDQTTARYFGLEGDSWRIKCRDQQAVEWVRLQLREFFDAMNGVKLEVVQD